MANTLLSQLVAPPLWKITSERTGAVLWRGLGVLSCQIMIDSSVVSEPLSTQDKTSDLQYVDLTTIDLNNGKILRPTKIRVTVLCNSISIEESLLSSFVDPLSSYSITSKSIISDAMMITDVEIVHDESMLSCSKITMEFEQWTNEVNGSYNPDGSYNASSYGVRIQTPATIDTSAISSVVDKATTSAEALYNKVSTFIAS